MVSEDAFPFRLIAANSRLRLKRATAMYLYYDEICTEE
jgi:hypothetical protein